MISKYFYPYGIKAPELNTQGTYENDSPLGAVIHYTASQGKNILPIINTARTNNYCFNIIDDQGLFYQTHELNRWGYHCGESEWGFLGKNLSRKLIGIEITSPGFIDTYEKKSFDGDLQLIKGKAWYDKEDKNYLCRYNNGLYNEYKLGWYSAFSEKQERTLIQFLLWSEKTFKKFSFDNVVGHHEISPIRKSDPSSCLSYPMQNFRLYLKEKSLTHNDLI